MHKIATFFDKVWNWLVVSSANPEKVSLTVKGFLGSAVSFIMILIGVTHIQIIGFPEFLNTIIDQIMIIIQDGLGIIAAVSTVIGLIRKIALSIPWFNSKPTI